MKTVHPAALAALAPLAAFIVLGAAPTVHAAEADPAAAKAGTYAVEPAHTRILFSVSHLGFTTWYGDFTNASGQLTIDPAHPAASKVQITVPIASVSTTNAKLDGELKDPDWFDAARYPTATFTSTRVTPTSPGHAEITGDLTLHGVTRPVVLAAKFNGSGVNPLDHAYTVGFDATGHIRRSEFGVSKYVPLVGDDVELILSAAFEKAAP